MVVDDGGDDLPVLDQPDWRLPSTVTRVLITTQFLRYVTQSDRRTHVAAASLLTISYRLDARYLPCSGTGTGFLGIAAAVLGESRILRKSILPYGIAPPRKPLW